MTLQKVKLWLKLGIPALIIILAGLIIYMNSKNETNIWFFGTIKDVGVLWIICITAVVSILAFKIFGTLRRTIIEFKEVRSKDKK